MAERKTPEVDPPRHPSPGSASQNSTADTPLVVTLEQLRPYDRNPRIVRNPRYDDIKASIRERGLDAPPAITRRPGEPYFIIRNGGNTRLSILRELWSETRDEKFFRIVCLFRDWPARGEILALTGHLAENELHGGLSFIERALGVEQARELYEQETGKPLTQMELARRLTQDGYPISQQHISRMQEAVRYLLPAIPSVLYAGLGKPQIERLSALRKAAARTWEHHARRNGLATDFTDLFLEILAPFNEYPASFNVQHVEDEIVRRLSVTLGVEHDAQSNEVAETSAHSTGNSARDAHASVVHGIPPQEDEPITASDLWYIEPALDAPDQLRAGIRHLAQEIARAGNVGTQIESAKSGVGFICTPRAVSLANAASPLLALLNALSAPYVQNTRTADIDGVQLASTLGPLLLGTLPSRYTPPGNARLGDVDLVKLFRLIRLARRLLELESARTSR